MFNSFKDKAKAIADLSAQKVAATASSSSSKLQELFDQNYPKIEPIIVNGLLKIGEEKLKDDKLLNTIFDKGYEILPFPVRLVISRARFLEFTMTHRDSLLQKVMTLKDQRNEKLSEKEISGQNAFIEQKENDIMQSKMDSIPDTVSYLFSLPTSAEELATGEIVDIQFCINYAIYLNNSGNHKKAVVWFNKALLMNPTFEFAIALHRNRTIAIGEEYDIGNGKSPRNLEFCIAMESILRDYEAIIGLYIQNEAAIKAKDDFDFFANSFEMAMMNFMPIGSSNMAYQENGSYNKYTDRIHQIWKITFVSEPKNGLCVNGKVYPQYVLPK